MRIILKGFRLSDYQNISINDESATVTLLENADIYFNSTPHIKSQMAGLKHTIKLNKQKNYWYIVEDIYYNEHKSVVDSYLQKVKTLDEAKNAYIKGFCRRS
ncbi:MAG TPA: hypothetical protein VFC58_06055 [Desulfosporosinus sp.]|nr:hypothetical protein [Desulfosporosinus sp.]